uniref:Uncharacterized protein n=1 Tax=Oryza rufipogon TaxID=4529 RepID=A0A0E0QW08_ORYRU
MWMDSDHIGGHNFLLDGWPVVRCWRGGCASKVCCWGWLLFPTGELDTRGSLAHSVRQRRHLLALLSLWGIVVKTMAWIPWTGCGGTFSVVSFLKEHFL